MNQNFDLAMLSLNNALEGLDDILSSSFVITDSEKCKALICACRCFKNCPNITINRFNSYIFLFFTGFYKKRLISGSH